MQKYISKIAVNQSHIDRHNHVNNIVYIGWMQDIATEHSEASGCTDYVYAQHKAWIIREHNIRYFAPAILGDEVIITTYPAFFEKFKSRRIYEMHRASDNKKLVEAWTDWVLFDTVKNRPTIIDDKIKSFFE